MRFRDLGNIQVLMGIVLLLVSVFGIFFILGNYGDKVNEANLQTQQVWDSSTSNLKNLTSNSSMNESVAIASQANNANYMSHIITQKLVVSSTLPVFIMCDLIVFLFSIWFILHGMENIRKSEAAHGNHHH